MGEFHLTPLFEASDSIQNARFGLLKRPPYTDLFAKKFVEMVEGTIAEVCDHAPVCGDRTPYPLRKTFVSHIPNLYIVRDGRDVLVSWIYHAFNRGLCSSPEMEAKRQVFENDSQYFEKNKRELLSCEQTVRSVARHWNETLVDDFAMMAEAKRGEIDLQYHFVRYEDLQVDTDHHREAMYSFLGVDPALAQPLTPHTQPQFGEPNFNSPTKFFRRGKSGTWKEYFTDKQLGWFEEEAADAMRLVGIDPQSSLQVQPTSDPTTNASCS